jgi:hypothetical protein
MRVDRALERAPERRRSAAGLLGDAELRLDECEQQPMLQAFRSAVLAHTSNTCVCRGVAFCFGQSVGRSRLAIGTVLLKLGVMQRELAEQRPYALNCAAATIRRSIIIFETVRCRDRGAFGAPPRKRPLGSAPSLERGAQELTAAHSATLKARAQLLQTLELLDDDAAAARERAAIAKATL